MKTSPARDESKGFSLRTRMLLLAAAAFTGILVVVTVSMVLLNEARIGGPSYRAIKVNKENQVAQKNFKRVGTLKAFSDSYKDNPLNKLDERFYALKEDSSALRIKFIRQNKELFISR